MTALPRTAAPTRAQRLVAAVWTRTDTVLILVAALITLVLTVFALELWGARLDVPFTYWGDALSIAAHFKTVFETGWYEFQPALGAPYGQTYNDFPVADNLNFAAADVLRLVTDDPIVGMNLYYVAGFPLAAATAVWFLRRCGISRALTVAFAVLFALAPYHFIRGEGHLFLASYFTIPIWLTLVLLVYRGDRMWGLGTRGSRARRILLSPTTRSLAIAALTATAHTYYAVFFLVLLAVAGVARFAMGGGWKRLLGAAAVGVVTVVLMLVNMAPDLLYAATEGQNQASLVRGHSDAEIYALKLSQLLLPWSGHRIGALQHIRSLYDQVYPLPSEQPALGIIGAIGLVLLLVGLVLLALSALRNRPRAAGPALTTFSALAVLTFAAMTFASVGGLSTIISFATSSIRGWNRMSIVIALLCLAAVGLALDAMLTAAVRRSWARRFGRPALAVLTAGGLLAVGYVDQTPANASSSYAATAATWDRDADFFAEVEDRLDRGDIVLQLPYQPFPESISATGTLSGDGLIPYLHTSEVRWSAGGIKGRPRADYPFALEHRDPAEIAVLAAIAGFSGILMDTAAMTDSDAAALDDGLRDAGAETPIASSDNRWLFYGLADLARSVDDVDAGLRDELSARIFNPLMIRMEPAFTLESFDGGIPVYVNSDPPAEVTVVNDTNAEITAEVRLDVILAADQTGSTIDVRLPDGSHESIPVTDGEGSAVIRFTAPAGISAIAITVSGDGQQVPVEFRLVAPAISDVAFEEAVARAMRELGVSGPTMLGSGP